MGYHAEDALGDSLDAEEYRLDYLTGRFSPEEAYDLGIIDEYESLDYPRPTKSVRCKYCKAGGFYWSQTPEGNWRLFDLNGVHTCSKYRKE